MILRLLIRVGLLIRFFVIELCLSERVRLLGLSCSVLSGAGCGFWKMRPATKGVQHLGDLALGHTLTKDTELRQ